MISVLPGLLSIALYLLASGLLMMRLSRGSSSSMQRLDQPILIALTAILVHAVILYPEVFTPTGLNLGFVYAASLVTLTSALLLAVSALFQPVGNLGIILFPVAAATIGLLLAYPDGHLLTDSSWQLDMHILCSLLAYSILVLAVLQAILLSIQDRHLRNRQPGGFIRALPPLAVMESLLFQMIATGFTLLTLALVTGILFLEDIFAQQLVHKTTLSIIAWIVFGILLWGRWRFGWRGRTALRWTIGGFVFLMLAYFGSKFVLELVLAR
ncbi:MAG: cytochrome c biogenesis protein CcsA [Gammaproteobacteria bacterium]